MKRILVTGAGGSPSTNFVRSLRESGEAFHLVGVDCSEYYLQRSETDESHLVTTADDPDYLPLLRQIIQETGAEMIYCQPDQEIAVVGRHRDELGVRTCLPDQRTIEICQDKFESFRLWQAAGIRVPETTVIRNHEDLASSFERFGSPVWLRAIVSPGGGKGSFRAADLRVAKAWIDFCDGWGNFTAAECLEPDSVTWTALYNRGELVVAQGRKRVYWEFANRAPSGVTGITGTGVTVSDPELDGLARRCIEAIDPKPHGIFAVDLTYDRDGVPNPTEINIGRFFTTHLFFTRAGLNLPHLLVKIAYGEEPPPIPRRINPLRPGLAWVRGMDFLPVLTDVETIQRSVDELAERRRRIAG